MKLWKSNFWINWSILLLKIVVVFWCNVNLGKYVFVCFDLNVIFFASFQLCWVWFLGVQISTMNQLRRLLERLMKKDCMYLWRKKYAWLNSCWLIVPEIINNICEGSSEMLFVLIKSCWICWDCKDWLLLEYLLWQ